MEISETLKMTELIIKNKMHHEHKFSFLSLFFLPLHSSAV